MKNTKFWIATEVNHTAAHTRKTLYVSGKQPLSDILRNATQNSITHVSFESGSLDTSDTYFLETVDALSVAGYTITIEYDIRHHDEVVAYLGTKLFTSRNIIPIAALGNIDITNINPNFTLAINDTAADGRWCIGPSAIMDSNRFTLFAECDPANAIPLDKPEVPEAAPKPVEVAAVQQTPADTSPQLAPEYPADPAQDASNVPSEPQSTVSEEPTVTVTETVEPAVETAPAEQVSNKRKKATNAE